MTERQASEAIDELAARLKRLAGEISSAGPEDEQLLIRAEQIAELAAQLSTELDDRARGTAAQLAGAGSGHRQSRLPLDGGVQEPLL